MAGDLLYRRPATPEGLVKEVAMKMGNGALIEALNRMLTTDHAYDAQIAYARKIRRRIQALGGVPTMDVQRSEGGAWNDAPPARTVVHDID